MYNMIDYKKQNYIQDECTYHRNYNTYILHSFIEKTNKHHPTPSFTPIHPPLVLRQYAGPLPFNRQSVT